MDNKQQIPKREEKLWSEIKNYQIKTNRNEAINSTRKKMDFLYQNVNFKLDIRDY